MCPEWWKWHKKEEKNKEQRKRASIWLNGQTRQNARKSVEPIHLYTFHCWDMSIKFNNLKSQVTFSSIIYFLKHTDTHIRQLAASTKWIQRLYLYYNHENESIKINHLYLCKHTAPLTCIQLSLLRAIQKKHKFLLFPFIIFLSILFSYFWHPVCCTCTVYTQCKHYTFASKEDLIKTGRDEIQCDFWSLFFLLSRAHTPSAWSIC